MILYMPPLPFEMGVKGIVQRIPIVGDAVFDAGHLSNGMRFGTVGFKKSGQDAYLATLLKNQVRISIDN